MAEAGVVEIDRLVAPLTEAGAESATGADLRVDPAFDSPYRLLKTLYKEARKLEDEAVRSQRPEDRAKARAEAPQKWTHLATEATEFLATKSKDMEVAAWLCEAATRTRGFEGLCNALRLQRELAERFWDDVHPKPDEERGYAPRVAALRGLIGDEREGAIIAPIRLLTLIEGADRELSLADYNLAQELEKYELESERESRAAAEGGVTLAQYESVALSADPSKLAATATLIEAACEEIDALEALLDSRCGTEAGQPVAPSFSNLRNVLKDECLRVLRQYSPEPESSEAEADAVDEGSPNGNAAAGGRLSAGADPAVSREAALQMVVQAAEFFRRTEPHSPVSYALHEVVRWGRMPLPKLMQELCDDDTDRRWFFKMVGVNRDD